jgi:hypothetical protein
MRPESPLDRAREKRRLAVLIRQYAAGLSCLDRRDLQAYAASIEAEADALERGDAGKMDDRRL